jgi:hypothetical protein
MIAVRSIAGAIALLVASVHVTAQSTATTAKPGERVILIINTVKADKRQQFEDYMTKFLAAAVKVAEADPMIKAVNQQTRTLHPVKANEDGTWTYVFLADPVVSDEAAYNMTAILKKVYPAEADRLAKQFEDSLVGAQQMIELIQPKR